MTKGIVYKVQHCIRCFYRSTILPEPRALQCRGQTSVSKAIGSAGVPLKTYGQYHRDLTLYTIQSVSHRMQRPPCEAVGFLICPRPHILFSNMFRQRKERFITEPTFQTHQRKFPLYQRPSDKTPASVPDQ